MRNWIRPTYRRIRDHSRSAFYSIFPPNFDHFEAVDSIPRPVIFRQYRPSETLCPITIVTPEDGCYIHTYYNVPPWSPSGRYLAVTKVPFQDHDPRYGERARVCVIDLQERTIRTIYSTLAWGFQFGANLHWGQTDQFLYTNNIVQGKGVCVRLDLVTGEHRVFAGGMTDLAPDESHVVGYPLDLLNKSQPGYGMPEVPGKTPRLPPVGQVDTLNGIWQTDLTTNRKSLLASVADFHRLVPNKEDFSDRSFTLFYSKFNKQGTRCLQFLRGMSDRPKPGHGKWIQMAFCHRPDGSDVVQTVTYGVHRPTSDWSCWRPDWSPGGHHISWEPDGEHLTMNLVPDGKNMRFCRFRYDGSGFRVLSEKAIGGGHPTLHASGHYLLSDAYPFEPVVLENKEVPIRLIDLRSDVEATICHIYTLGRSLKGGSLRCDPHPCWSRDGRQVCFNGTPEGKRQVLIADLAGIL